MHAGFCRPVWRGEKVGETSLHFISENPLGDFIYTEKLSPYIYSNLRNTVVYSYSIFFKRKPHRDAFQTLQLKLSL